MTRGEAIKTLAQHAVKALRREERESLLVDWWTIDAGDPAFPTLSNDLRTELLGSDGPDDAMDGRYDALLEIALRDELVGTLNSYLASRVSTILGFEVVVEGDVEELAACPCCRYRTIRERGYYEICPVCFWEDDGSDDPDRHGGPNHMSLGEARTNFKRYGAMSESAREHVLRDGKQRYRLG